MNAKHKLPDKYAMQVGELYEIYTCKSYALLDEIVNFGTLSNEGLVEYKIVAMKQNTKEEKLSLLRVNKERIFSLKKWHFTNKGLEIDGINVPIIDFVQQNR